MAAARAGVSRFLVFSVSLALLALAMSAPLVAAKNGGNSANAKLCQNGGWMGVQGSDGTLFAGQGECVSYGAHGGTIVPIPALPHITLSPGPRLLYCDSLAACFYDYDFGAPVSDDTGIFTVTNNTANSIDMLATTFEGDLGYTNSDSCGSQTVGPGGTCSFAITATPATCTTSEPQETVIVSDASGDSIDLVVAYGPCGP